MSWLVSASRTSSSDCAEAGTRSSPGQALCCSISSERLACWVSVIGRECGAAIGTEPDRHHQPHVEPLDHVAHRAGEALPAGVGLGAGEQQVGALEAVAHQPHHQARGVVVLEVVADERDAGPAGAVVVEGVDVEGGHDRAGALLDEVVDGQRAGVARVEEAVQTDQQRQRLATGLVGHFVHDVHELHAHVSVLMSIDSCSSVGDNAGEPRRCSRVGRGGEDHMHHTDYRRVTWRQHPDL